MILLVCGSVVVSNIGRDENEEASSFLLSWSIKKLERVFAYLVALWMIHS